MEFNELIVEKSDGNLEQLSDYTKIVVETDEENPVTVASITSDAIDIEDGYRVRLTPVYD